MNRKCARSCLAIKFPIGLALVLADRIEHSIGAPMYAKSERVQIIQDLFLDATPIVPRHWRFSHQIIVSER